MLNQELGIPAVPPSSRQYVPRFVSELELSDEMRRLAERLANEAEANGLVNGRNPAGVAAGCLYEAAQEQREEVTQRALGTSADVSAVTIRSRWREVRETVVDD